MAKARNCFKCDSKFGLFRWRRYCEECGRIFCSDCIIKFRAYEWYAWSSSVNKYKNNYLCIDCWNEHIKGFDNKYLDSLERFETVESFPKTYRGKIPIKKNISSVTIESEYFKNRDNCLVQLKVTALVEGYDVIYDVEWIKKTDSETSESGKGTYYYTVWKAICKAGKLR